MNSDLPFQDTLSKHFETIFISRYFNGANSGFQVLVNKPEIVLSDELRFDLTSYFEHAIEDVERSMEGMGEFDTKYKIDYLFHFKNERADISEWSIIIPKNYSNLRMDEAFKTSLYLLRDDRHLTSILISRFIGESENILVKLQNYVRYEFGIS